MGQNAFRQALQDRTGLEPIMDVRDSAVNSLHLAGDAGTLGQGFSSGRSPGGYDWRASPEY